MDGPIVISKSERVLVAVVVHIYDRTALGFHEFWTVVATTARTGSRAQVETSEVVEVLIVVITR